MRAHTLLLAALCPLLLAAPMAAVAGPKADKELKRERRSQDHEFARQALQRREVLPLPRILALAGEYQRGDIIELELKSKAGVLTYEVEILVPSGEVRKLLLDARTGRLLPNVPKKD